MMKRKTVIVKPNLKIVNQPLKGKETNSVTSALMTKTVQLKILVQ